MRDTNLVQLFTDFASDPNAQWGDPLLADVDYLWWRSNFGIGVEWTLEQETDGLVTKFRWQPLTLPEGESYQALRVQSDDDGNITHMVVYTIIQSRLAGIEPHCHAVVFKLDTGDVRYFVREGAGIGWADEPNLGADDPELGDYVEMHFSKYAGCLVDKIASLLPYGMRVDNRVAG